MDTGSELRRRVEIALAAFTLLLAVVVGYMVIATAVRSQSLLSATSAWLQIVMVGTCLAAVVALSAILHGDVPGPGRRAVRRLALIVALGFLGLVFRMFLWLFPKGGTGL